MEQSVLRGNSGATLSQASLSGISHKQACKGCLILPPYIPPLLLPFQADVFTLHSLPVLACLALQARGNRRNNGAG